MIKTSKYYKIALLPASIIAIIIYLVWGVISYDPNYRSEWMTSGTAIIWGVLMVIVNALIVAVLSLTIFFNDRQNVRSSLMLSFLTWFLSPMIWIGYLLFQVILLLLKGSIGDWDFLLLNSLPYLIGLIWGFVKFRNDI